MEQTTRRRGRPRVFRTKDVVERRRLAKKKSNDSRRNLNGTVPHDPTDPRGCAVVDGETSRREGFPDHGGGSVPPVADEIHHDVNAGTGGNTGESKRMRKSIDQQKKLFGENNLVLNIGRQEETCGFCAAKVWAAEFTGRHVGTGPKGYSICCSKGKVQLPLLRETPPELSQLIAPTGLQSNRYRVVIRIEDSSATTTLTLFNKEAEQLIGIPLQKILAELEENENDAHLPTPIKNIIGKFYAFKIKVTPYNITRGCEEYAVTRVSESSPLAETDPPTIVTKRQKTA